MNNPNSGGFSFGQPANSGFSFGQQAGSSQSPASPFSQPAQSTATAMVNPLSSGGFSFNSPKTTQSSFANPSATAQPTAGFGFSTPSTSTPAVGGFNFGGGPPAYSQPGGMNTGQQFGFGATTSASGFAASQPTTSTTGGLPSMSGSFNFGKPSTPFGQTSSQTPQTAVVVGQPAGGFGFNQPATNPTGFGLSQTPSTAASGFNLGTVGTTGGFGLANTATSTNIGGFGLGSSTTATGAFQLGGSTTTQGASTGFNLAPAAPATGMGLGGATTGGLNFSSTFSAAAPSGFGLTGAPSSNLAAGGFSLGGTLATANTTTTGGFSLANAAPTQTGGFSLPTTGGFGSGSSNTPFSLGTTTLMGGFPANTSAAPSSMSFGLAATPTPSSSFGLGGTFQPSLSGGFNAVSTIAPTTAGFSLNTVQPGGIKFPNAAAPTTSGFAAQTMPAAPIAAASTTVGINASAASGFTLGQALTSTTGFNLPGAAPGLAVPSGTSIAGSSTGLTLGQFSAAATPTPGFTLGQPVPSTGGINFSTGTTPTVGVIGTSGTPVLNSTTTAAITSGTTGGFGGFGVQLSAPKPGGFTMGPTSTSIAPAAGFFGQPTSALTAGQTSVTTTSSTGLGGATTTVTGLGGAQVPATDADQVKKADGKSIRETPLPPDIFSTIATFETYKDAEKKASEENARQSATPFHKLGEDAKKLKQHIVKLSNQHAHLHNSAAKLKSFVVQDALNVEMARRTQDTPMNLQGENKLPEEFFLKMVRSFEGRMASCRNKINEVEKGCTFKEGMSETTPEDIMIVLKREHRAVKMMAAQVYTIHNKLIDVYQKSDSKAQPKPELLFRTTSPEKVDLLSIINKDSSVLRPCLGGISSGLMEFQYGQQRAKALSLGAAPPTQALGQSGSSFLSPQVSQSSIFNSSALQSPAPLTLGQNTNNSSFNFGKRPFGSANSSFSSPFSLPNPASGSLFSPNANSTSFGIFGK